MRRLLAQATLFVVCGCAPVLAQGADPPRFEIFVGTSANVDYIPNRPILIVSPGRDVSQFFSHGSGPDGFDLSVAHTRTRHVAWKGAASMYTDTFTGEATYCQPTACGTGLTFTDHTRTFFFTAGPEFRVGEGKRLALFGHAMAGVVHARSTFAMAGSNVTHVDNFAGAGFIVISGSPFPRVPNVSYANAFSDTGLTMTAGGGFDIRVVRRLRFRALMDFNPTFLVRPDLGDPSVFQPDTFSRRRQDHVRLSLGVVWRFQ